MLAAPLAVSSPFPSSLAGNDDQGSYKPTADLEAFKNLLPPAVEFVEASSSTLSVAEGKYQAINETPNGGSSKDSPDLLHPPTPTPAQRDRAPRRSLNGTSAELQLHSAEIDISWPPTFNLASGLCNTGNTCFLNSALQCLLHTPPLLRVIIQHHDQKSCRVKSGFCMTCNMRQTILRAYSKKAPFPPDLITNKLPLIAKHLRRGRQEDSHEFLRYAIDALQKSCLAGLPPKPDPKVAETTWVHKIFGGKLRSRVTCQSCGHNSDTFDNNLDISLDIFKTNTLKDAFRKFFTPDHLKGSDKYKCEKCKRAVDAEKRFSIKEAPTVLTVHLKRFSPFGNKIGHHVDYDNTISLKPYMSDGQYGPTYSLYGIICHAGGGPNSGHYFAFVKSKEGKWFEMNDESVSSFDNGLPVKKNAYMLFYLRNKGDRLSSAISQVPETMPMPRSVISSMKRKARDGEDTGKPFIGPVIPSATTDSPSSAKKQKMDQGGDPQAAMVKKKIESTQIAKASLSELAKYDSDDGDDDKQDDAATDKPKMNGVSSTESPVQTSLTPVPVRLAPSPISPAQFYGGSQKSYGKKNRIPPSADWKHKIKGGFSPYTRFTNGKKKSGRPRPL